MKELEKQQAPKGILEYISPKSFFRKEKVEEIKVIQLDKEHKFIKFYNGIVNIYGNIVFGKHEIIPQDIFTDEYGQRHAFHIGTNILGYKLFEEKKEVLYRREIDEEKTTEKAIEIKKETKSLLHPFKKLDKNIEITDKDEITQYKYIAIEDSLKIIEKKNEVISDTLQSLSSIELAFFGKIKILDEIADINPAQFYFGLAVGGIVGGILTFLLLYFLLSL